MEFDFLDKRPIIVAIAGSNGAGKTTFYHAFLANTELRFINADDLARELNAGPYEAAETATPQPPSPNGAGCGRGSSGYEHRPRQA